MKARLACGVIALGVVALCSACGGGERMIDGRPAFTDST